MAQLISCTVFVKDSTVMSPSTIYALPGDQIKFVTSATVNQKHAAPAASQGINTAVYITDMDNNTGVNHIYLVNEAVSSFVSGS